MAKHQAPPTSSVFGAARLARTATALLAVGAVTASAFAATTAMTAHPGNVAKTKLETSSVQNVRDDFGRTVKAGLGSALAGGSYSTWPGNPSVAGFSVSAGCGRSTSTFGSGDTLRARLNGVRTLDQSLQASLLVSSLPTTGNGLYVSLGLRTVGNQTAYTVQARVGVGGILRLELARRLPSGESILASEIALPGRISAGKTLYVAAAVTGTTSPLLQGRAWYSGQSDPAWQLARQDSSKLALTAPGGVGFDSYESTATRGMSFAICELWGRTVAPSSVSTPSPTPSSTSASSTPSSSSPAPSSSSVAAPPSSSSAPSSDPSTPVPTTSSSQAAPSDSSTPTSAAPSSPTSSAPAPAQPQAVGSAPVGTTDYAAPADAIYVSPTGNDAASGTIAAPLQTVARAIALAGNGQTIVLRGGEYHSSLFIPKTANVTIQSYPGEAVWFDGSSVVSSWQQVGSTWVHSGWTAQFDHSASFSKGSNAGGFVDPAHPMAAYPDQVFVNGVQLDQVPTGQTPGQGQFAVDYSAGTITIGSDPTNSEVRASDLGQAFVVAGQATLRGFGVRRYATSLPQMGTVFFGGAVGHSTVQNVVIDNNATQGLSMDSLYDTVDHVTVTNNGMTGIHANQADYLSVTNSVVAGNNAQYFNPEPSAANIKITQTRHVTVAGNTIIDPLNKAYGLWTDQSVVDFTFVNNFIRSGGRDVQVELSDTGIIANNTIVGGSTGIEVLDTGNVKIFNNSLSGNSLATIYLSQDVRRESNASINAHDSRQPIPDPSCPWLTRNITISNNVFGQWGAGEAFQVYALDAATNIPADAMNIVVNGNQFTPRTQTGQPWAVGWGGNDNHTLRMFANVDAFQAAINPSWNNSIVAPGSAVAATTSVAQALPDDVATAIGVPLGTVHLGTF